MKSSAREGKYDIAFLPRNFTVKVCQFTEYAIHTNLTPNNSQKNYKHAATNAYKYACLIRYQRVFCMMCITCLIV